MIETPLARTSRLRLVVIFIAIAALQQISMMANAAQPSATDASLTVYIGTYTGPKSTSKGIHALRFDPSSGALTPIGLVAESSNPSFLALHPNGEFLFAVNEVGEFEKQKSGAVSAFRRDGTTGRLTLINQRASKGGAPCHIVVDRSGKFVLVANYTGGNVAVLPIGKDGSLGEAVSVVQHEGSGPNAQRQKGPHAHSINVDQTNRFAVAADLGIDKLLVYRFDAATGSAVGERAAFGVHRSGGRAAAFRVHARRPVCPGDQRTGVHADVIRLEGGYGRADDRADRLDAAGSRGGGAGRRAQLHR